MNDKLDQHSIVIRKRTLPELTDLAIKLGRQEFFTLATLFIPLATAFFLLNRFVLGSPLGWIALNDMNEYTGLMRYGCVLVALMLLELPFSTSLMRSWLGLRTFSRVRRPGAAEAFFNWFAAIPQLAVFHLVLAPLFFFHLYLPEVIQLEKTPFRRSKRRPSSTIRRTRQLHKGHGGEAFGFYITAMFFGTWFVIGAGVIVVSLVRATFGQIAEEQSAVIAFYLQNIFPLLAWAVFGFLGVLLFLRYLNLRIEKEGWDVDLAFRIERNRMQIDSLPAASVLPLLLTGLLLVLLCGTSFALSDAPTNTASDTTTEGASNAAVDTTSSPTLDDDRVSFNTPESVEKTDAASLRSAKRSLGRRVAVRDYPWYSSQSDSVTGLPFPRERTRASGSSTSSSTPLFTGAWVKPMLYAFGFVLLILLLLALYFLVKYALERWFGADFLSAEARKEAAEKQRRIETLPVEAQADYNDLLAATMRAANAGDWRGALILYFSYMLVELDRAECIRLHRGKTNHEYAWELGSRSELRYYYCETMYLFEKVYFGEYPIDRDLFETVWRNRDAFRTLLPQRDF